MAPARELTIHFDDGGFRVATYANVFISVWTGPPTGARLAAMRAAQARMSTVPDPVGAITILRSLDPRKLDLRESARAELVKIWRTGNTRRGASVVAIEAEGLLAAAARALLSTIKILARSVNPSAFVARREEAARWIVPYLSTPERPGPTETELLGAIDQVARGLNELAGAG